MSGLRSLALRLPVNDVRELPGILTQLPLQVAILFNDELCCWIQHPRTLLAILIVDINLACGQVEGFRLGVLCRLPEGALAVGN